MAVALDRATIEQLADELLEAERTRVAIAPLTERYPGLDVRDAYAIQLAIVARKTAAGARVVGKKIGLTSRAMQRQLAVDQPDYGHLFDTMMVIEGGDVPVATLLQPRVEPEIAFVLKADLPGPGVTREQVLAATAYVTPAIEIIDSRVRNWQIKLGDTVADNGSSARVVLGSVITPVDAVDLRLVGCVLEKNGEVISTGAGAAVLGDPALSVAWLANTLASFGIPLQAGEIILPGSLTRSEPVRAGDVVRATYDRLGSVSVRFV
ncbi:MAG TPA: fumarylacetoacetate hydrolase family protein [Chloroflexota bacterium]|jgi:2-keto-4-pentenoate hydratase|nr:fumarylacetoacetate hydrolase family protein [Chloroflexota bacterium]